jgi:hypothetical protein
VFGQFVQSVDGFLRFGGFGVVAQEEAPGGAVVVETLGGRVEGEVDTLAVVAVEGGVVEVVGEVRCGQNGVGEFARDRGKELGGERFGGVAD